MMLATVVQMELSANPSLDRLYFLVAGLIAFLPVVVFGTIGFLTVRAYFRDRARKPDPAPTPTGAARG